MLRAVLYPSASGGPSAPLVVSASPSYIGETSTTSNGTTSTTTVSATGGTGPYTYAWTELTDVTGVYTSIDSPASATTGFNYAGIRFSEYGEGTFKCTVTDSVGNTGYTIITVYVQYEEV